MHTCMHVSGCLRAASRLDHRGRAFLFCTAGAEGAYSIDKERERVVGRWALRPQLVERKNELELERTSRG